MFGSILTLAIDISSVAWFKINAISQTISLLKQIVHELLKIFY